VPTTRFLRLRPRNGAFSKIKDGLVFPFNLPAIIELGTATGFDFELIDQAGLGHEKLTEARNQLLGMAAEHPDTAGSCTS
jgi:multidrug efflux pump